MSNKSTAENILDKVKQASGVSPEKERQAVLEKYGYKSMDDLTKTPLKEDVAVGSVTEDEALAEWCKGKQATVIMSHQNINMQRLHAVLPDRIRDAFRAGFAAGRRR